MKKPPIGLGNLKEFINDGYTYVDKTWYVHELVTTGKYYFLSRPRRFGKSLFVDTLKETFEGNKGLFKGLYIYGKWDWDVRYPVIHISFESGVLKNRQELDKRLLNILRANRERLKVECRDIEDVASCFMELITKATERYGRNVVMLIDEYDKMQISSLSL